MKTIIPAAALLLAALATSVNAAPRVSEKDEVYRQLPSRQFANPGGNSPFVLGDTATVTITIGSTPVYDEFGSPLNVVNNYNLATLSGITPSAGDSLAVFGIGFSGSISATAPSWRSDISLLFSDSAVNPDTAISYTPSGTNSAGTESVTTSGIIDFQANGLDPIATLGDHLLRVEFADTFDDLAGADGNVNSGTLTLDVREIVTPVPLPPPTLLFSGDLAPTDPIFNRPSSSTSLSAVGTAVSYDVTGFTVDTNGEYEFEQRSGDVDSYLLVYAGSFDPNNPLANLVALDDDSGDGAGDSALEALLTAGTQYYIVDTSFDNAEFGDYDVFAGGVGIISLTGVPEPVSLLSIGGLTMLVGIRRRSAVAA